MIESKWHHIRQRERRSGLEQLIEQPRVTPHNYAHLKKATS